MILLRWLGSLPLRGYWSGIRRLTRGLATIPKMHPRALGPSGLSQLEAGAYLEGGRGGRGPPSPIAHAQEIFTLFQ